MKKCGLKRAYAQGGVLPDQMQNIGSDNPINAEREARWRMDDVESKMKYAADPNQQKALGGLWNSMNKDYTARFAGDRTLPPPPGALAAQQEEASVLGAFNKMMGFRQGGTVGVDQRGFIEGPGGVDNVPARIDETGEEIRVGAGERIVNKKQNAALEALAAQAGMSLDEYLEASTQEPVGPTMKNGLRAAQNGWPVPYDPIRGQQVAPGGANTYAPRSTVPVQDGVRMGAPNPPPRPNFEYVSRAVVPYGQQSIPPSQPRNIPVQDGVRVPGQAAQTQRPNWIDPTRQVATIDGAAQRVPAGPGTAVVPTNGRTQFHDKISAEEMARGNQNRAAGFRAAAEATPAGVPSGLRTAGRVLGAAGMVAPIVAGAMSDSPTLKGKVVDAFGGDSSITKQQRDDAAYAKKNAKLPWYAGPGGAMAPTAQLAEVGAAQRAKDRAPHDGLRANFVDGNGNGKFVMPTLDKRASRAATAKALANSDSLVTPTTTLSTAQTARMNNLDYQNLEPAIKSGRSDFMGEKDATEYHLPPGAAGGFVTRSAKGGLRNTTYLSGAASAADAARDKEFAAKGYAKDGYGNWMTPQRIADKQALAQIQSDRAKFNAFSDQVNDPRARAAGLRKVMFDMKQQELGNTRDVAMAKAKLDAAKFDQDERRLRMDATKADREFGSKQMEANTKDIDAWMDTMAPTAGLKDEALAAAQHKRAVLQQVMGNHWGGNVPQDRQAFLKTQPQMAREAQATMRLYDVLGQQGFWDKWVRNNGTRPARTMQALSPTRYDQDSDMLTLADGYKVKGKEIWGNDADMRAAITGRIK